MKKKYEKPDMQVEDVEVAGFLCASNNYLSLPKSQTPVEDDYFDEVEFD